MTTPSDRRGSATWSSGLLRRLRTTALVGSCAALVATVGISVVAPTSAAAQTAPVRAQAAEDFVQSLGVATHFTYHDTPYMNYPLMAQRMRELGVKHVRDGWGTGSAYASTFVRDTLGPMGVKITMVFDPLNNATALQHKEMVKSQLLPVIGGIESLNEWDVRGGAGWASYAREWTANMSRTYRGDPATAHIPLIGPSMAHTLNAPNHAAMGDLSPFVDYGNTHDYPGDRYQMTDGIIDIVQQNVGTMVPGKPIQATETGFTNGNVNALYPAMPESQVGVVLPRLYLDHFRRGIARSFSYELIDQYPNDEFESRFGLLRHDGTPKASFHAVASLTSLLSDPGPRFTPGTLSYSLNGGDAATRQLLLQKRDGTFWLAVWQQNAVWDGSRVLNPPDRSMTLELADATDAAVHRLGVTSATPVASHRGVTAISLSSSEEVTLVKLTPATAPETSSPTPTTSPPPVANPTPTPVTSPSPVASPAPVKPGRAKLCSPSKKCWDSTTASTTASSLTEPSEPDVSYLAGDSLCLVVGDEQSPSGTTCTRGRSAGGSENENAFLTTVDELAGSEARAVAAAWFALEG